MPRRKRWSEEMNEANEAACQDDGRRQNGVVLQIVALATLSDPVAS